MAPTVFSLTVLIENSYQHICDPKILPACLGCKGLVIDIFVAFLQTVEPRMFVGKFEMFVVSPFSLHIQAVFCLY